MTCRRVLALVCALSLACYIDALLNAHLFSPRRAPVGTIVRSSRIARNAPAILARSADDDDDDDGYESDDELEIMIWIEDPKAEVPIRCYMESSTEIDGKRYALAHPVDIPVIIATCEDEEKGLDVIEDEAEIDALFSIAKDVLADEGFELKRTPYMLTVEEDDEAFDTDEMSDEEEMDMYDEDEDDEAEPDLDEIEDGAEVRCAGAAARSPLAASRTVQHVLRPPRVALAPPPAWEVLAKFFHAGRQYYVAEPLEPTFILARQVAGTRFALLDDSEMERVKPMLERSFVELNEAAFVESEEG